VTNGVMVVTDDERGWRNEAGRLIQRLGDASRRFKVYDSMIQMHDTEATWRGHELYRLYFAIV